MHHEPERKGSETLNSFWHISLRSPGSFSASDHIYSFIAYLRKFGTIKNLAVVSRSSDIAVLDPEECRIGFEIDINSKASKEDIAGSFEFMGDDCVIRILPPHSSIAEYVSILRDLPETAR